MIPIANRILVAVLPRCGSVALLAAVAERRGVAPLPGQSVHLQFASPWSHNWGFYEREARGDYDQAFLVVRDPVERLKSARKLLAVTDPMVPRKWERFLDYVERSKMSDPHLIPAVVIFERLGGPEVVRIEEVSQWLPRLGIGRLRKLNRGKYDRGGWDEPSGENLERIRSIYQRDIQLGSY